MPDGRNRRLAAHVDSQGRAALTGKVAAPIGMLLWRRPGQPYICLEPTIGYYADGSNENLHVWPNSSVVLVTAISV